MSFVRRHLTTIVLVVAATAGSVALLVADRENATTEESDLRKKNLVPRWKPEDIRSISLTTRGKTARLSLGEPSDAGQRLWEIEIDGGRFLASQQNVDQLLGTLEYATFERRVSESAKEEGDLGLEKPGTVVTIEMGSKTYRIAIGGTAATPKDARYCQTGEGTFVITAQLATAIDVRPESLRSRVFVPYLSTELAKLVVEGEGGSRRFARATWGGSRGAGFRFDGTTPEGEARADAETFDRLLGALGTMQAESFLADEDADKALQKRVTLTLVPRDTQKPKAVIEVGGKCPGKDDQVVVVRREPSRTSACVPDGIVEPLIAPVKDYVDLAVVGARFDEITEVAVTRDGRTIEIARKGVDWHMRKPADRKVSGDAGNALVKDLTALTALRIEAGTLKDLGLEPPRATLRVTSSVTTVATENGAGERVETIEIGEPKGDVVHVRRLEDGVILALPADGVRALSPSEAVLRDVQVLEVPGEQVRALAVIQTGSGAAQAGRSSAARTQRIARGADGWSFVEPASAAIAPDIRLVSELVDAVTKLRAVRWVAEKDDGSFGLEKPRLVIEFNVVESEGAPVKAMAIELGAASNDGSFARIKGDPAVFVAPRTLEDAAGLWLHDRHALVLDAPALVRIEAAAEGGKKISAERAGDTWKAAGGDAAVVGTLRDVVTGLVAESVVSVGPPDRSFGLEKPRLVLTVLAEPLPGAPKGSPRRTIRTVFGAGDSLRGTSIVYARRDGLDVTFAVAQGQVRALFDAAGVP